MLHRVTISPLRHRQFSDLTGCDVSSLYGFRASCVCGWKGRVRSTVGAARKDFAEHRLDLLRP